MNASHQSNGYNRLVRSAVSAILALGAFHAVTVNAQARVDATGPDGSSSARSTPA